MENDFEKIKIPLKALASAPFKTAKWWGKNPYRAGFAAGAIGTVLYGRHRKKKKFKRAVKRYKPFKYSIGVTTKYVLNDIDKLADSILEKGGKGSGWHRGAGHVVGSQGGRKKKVGPTFRIRRGERVARGVKYVSPGLWGRIRHIVGRLKEGFIERGATGAVHGMLQERKKIKGKKVGRRAYYERQGRKVPKKIGSEKWRGIKNDLVAIGSSAGKYAVGEAILGATVDATRGIQDVIRRDPYLASINVSVEPNILRTQASGYYDALTGKRPAEEVAGPKVARLINRRLGIERKASPIAARMQLKERQVAVRAKKKGIPITTLREKKYLEHARKFKRKYRRGVTKSLLKSVRNDLEDMEVMMSPVSGTLLVRQSLTPAQRRKRKKKKRAIAYIEQHPVVQKQYTIMERLENQIGLKRRYAKKIGKIPSKWTDEDRKKYKKHLEILTRKIKGGK